MPELEAQKPNRKLILSKETVRTLTTSGSGPDQVTKGQSCQEPVPTEVCHGTPQVTKGQSCIPVSDIDCNPPTQGCHGPAPTHGQGCHHGHH